MPQWFNFRSRCPGKGCFNPDEIYWRHATCYNTQYINEEGFIKCKTSDCIKPTFIMEFSFRCQNHSDFRKCSGENVLDAILIAMKITTLPKNVKRDLIDKLNNYDDDEDLFSKAKAY